jgi:2,3-bisphosphoglycerate-dependent phosphoglycerate mutase
VSSVPTEIVFETHSWSEDNDRGVATGWLPGKLSARGRQLASELGARRRHDNLAAVFTSDLRRAVETATIAFPNGPDILHDWRLRECDYGALNGRPAVEIHRDRTYRINTPYPGGESWRQAVARIGRFLDDLPMRWSNTRILVIGHVATRWGLEHLLNGVALENLVLADFDWRPGWQYYLP